MLGGVGRLPGNGRPYPISASLVSEPKPGFQSSFDLEHLIRCQLSEHANHFDCRYRDYILNVKCTCLQESRCDRNFEPGSPRAGCVWDKCREHTIVFIVCWNAHNQAWSNLGDHTKINEPNFTAPRRCCCHFLHHPVMRIDRPQFRTDRHLSTAQWAIHLCVESEIRRQHAARWDQACRRIQGFCSRFLSWFTSGIIITQSRRRREQGTNALHLRAGARRVV